MVKMDAVVSFQSKLQCKKERTRKDKKTSVCVCVSKPKSPGLAFIWMLTRFDHFLVGDLLWFSTLLLSDAEDMHTLHSRAGHHDLLRRSDLEQDPNAQRRLRSPHRPGVCFCWSIAAAGDGRHRNGPPQCNLPHLRRSVVFFLSLNHIQ